MTVGISKFAAAALGDIVHVELPEAGNDCDAGEAIVSSNFYLLFFFNDLHIYINS